MTDTNSDEQPAGVRPIDESDMRERRNFLLLLPAIIFGGIATTMAAAAFRFLRPHTSGTDAKASGEALWIPLAPVSDLAGEQPLLRKVSVEHADGWASTRVEHTVYVLPSARQRVVSAVCPHEGCEVMWREREREFLCPCHDSHFNSDGAHLKGPAQRDLAELPARVEGGVLQIQYESPALDSATQRQTPDEVTSGRTASRNFMRKKAT